MTKLGISEVLLFYNIEFINDNFKKINKRIENTY